jgi:hypothetical protein
LFQHGVVALLGFGRRYVADGLQETSLTLQVPKGHNAVSHAGESSLDNSCGPNSAAANCLESGFSMRAIKSTVARIIRRASLTLDYLVNESALPRTLPRGHFYSPMPDARAAAAIAAAASQKPPAEGIAGIDLRHDDQYQLLSRMIDLYAQFDWPTTPAADLRFHFHQDWFKEGDAIALYSMLRTFKPQHVVEVGSGFSSALMLDVNDRFLNGDANFTFIEPYPDRLNALLNSADRLRTKIIQKPVQEIGTEFAALQPGDFLFVDSSHVSRSGSDVNFLMFEIIPSLPKGVFIHFHDIFWPFEYPAEWLADGCAWNETYLLRAFLMFNPQFRTKFWVPYAAQAWPEIISAKMPRYMKNTGASFWVEKIS